MPCKIFLYISLQILSPFSNVLAVSLIKAPITPQILVCRYGVEPQVCIFLNSGVFGGTYSMVALLPGLPLLHLSFIWITIKLDCDTHLLKNLRKLPSSYRVKGPVWTISHGMQTSVFSSFPVRPVSLIATGSMGGAHVQRSGNETPRVQILASKGRLTTTPSYQVLVRTNWQIQTKMQNLAHYLVPIHSTLAIITSSPPCKCNTPTMFHCYYHLWIFLKY